jgi:hypothetical protein
MRLEGCPKTPVQAAILRDARKGALLRMRPVRGAPELMSFIKSVL